MRQKGRGGKGRRTERGGLPRTTPQYPVQKRHLHKLGHSKIRHGGQGGVQQEKESDLVQTLVLPVTPPVKGGLHSV